MSDEDELDYLAYREAADDNQMRDLFKSLDSLKAPEGLKARALAAAIAAAEAGDSTAPYDVSNETIPFNVGAELAGDAIAPETETAAAAAAVTTVIEPSSPVQDQSTTPHLKVVDKSPHHAKSAPKARVRGWKRLVAVAASVVLVVSLVSGSVVFATPSAEVTLGSDDGSSVELDVNRFGRVLKADANGEGAEYAINGLGVFCRPFDDVVADFMCRERMDGQGTWLSTIMVSSNDEGLAQSIKNKTWEAESRMGHERGRFAVWRDGFEEPPNRMKAEPAVVMQHNEPQAPEQEQQPVQERTTTTETQTNETSSSEPVAPNEPVEEQEVEETRTVEPPQPPAPVEPQPVEPARPEPRTPTEPIFANPIDVPELDVDPNVPVRVDESEGIVG